MTLENRQIIIETLCTLLTDTTNSSTIRICAVQSLGRLGAETSIPLLCQLVLEESDTNLRLAVMDALVMIAQSPFSQLMSEQSKNQPIFKINQVGNINSGDVTISGNQVGIQHNYAPEAKTKPDQQLARLLSKLRDKYPNKTDAELFEILLNGFATMPQNNPQNWQRWQDSFSILFAGVVEAAKISVPIAGIPIEVLKRLYEIYDRNRKQLPEN
ncbi:MAG: HEAT repeat domain-containing protein [Phormidium sp. BM_Day4_Bin.17]|nr:HEAT repeat domain-containing protein [Phormidium sp. BM_Day4_Bin.17]UCJ10649.1 MAG: HEAT repeat domain-containing protein [Phormidium sp. PBR-2020]